MPGETDEITGPNVAGPTPDHAARNLPPRYPRDAEGRHPEGTVVLRLVVGADGAVAAADVLRSSGHLVLDEAARAAVLRWRFRPALRDGLPVPSALPYSFRFTHDARAPLPDDAPDPTGSVP
jgi:protein TonB